ncbi:hypothetical protein CEP54_016167 [Fusarium duplospermum]|uniref:Uncharacterized protein n=1 Tax=Fusarium duplospermum TaxID=1325734 RepID=A0A428NHF6_9HYPO|nr:hypothetical protein CEP54_016167 [Fusarium duplospermum]
MSRLKLPSLPIPLIALLLTPLLPVASAESAAGAVDTAGFWLGFCLLVVVSAAESAASIVWTRFHVTDDGIHPCELSCRVCGREIFVNTILPQVAIEIAENGLPAGVNSYSSSTTTFSRNGIVTQGTTSSACSCFGGMETRDTWAYDGTMETAIEKFFSLMLVPKLLIRRFNPSMALNAPAGLLRNIQGLVSPDKERSVKAVEHAVHLLVGIADIALGIAGLALIPSSPQKLYDTLKDPEAAMTFENYLTLFLLYWLLVQAPT